VLATPQWRLLDVVLLELPRLLVDVLRYFDGRSTAEALRRIRTEREINVQPNLVRWLVDFGVLIEHA
jgi:hypothetical protein